MANGSQTEYISHVISKIPHAILICFRIPSGIFWLFKIGMENTLVFRWFMMIYLLNMMIFHSYSMRNDAMIIPIFFRIIPRILWRPTWSPEASSTGAEALAHAVFSRGVPRVRLDWVETVSWGPLMNRSTCLEEEIIWWLFTLRHSHLTSNNRDYYELLLVNYN